MLIDVCKYNLDNWCQNKILKCVVKKLVPYDSNWFSRLALIIVDFKLNIAIFAKKMTISNDSHIVNTSII